MEKVASSYSSQNSDKIIFISPPTITFLCWKRKYRCRLWHEERVVYRDTPRIHSREPILDLQDPFTSKYLEGSLLSFFSRLETINGFLMTE